MLNIVDRQYEESIPPILRLGFRPFFTLAGLYAIVAIAIWLWLWPYGYSEQLQVPALWWHVHEMIFGFSMAVVVGFVLTAVQNWTGMAGTKSTRLAVLISLWLLPRILLWLPVPLWLTASIEALFLTLVAWEVGHRVIKAKGWRNLFFVPLFALAIFANFAAYAAIKGGMPFTTEAVWHAMLWWFAILLSVMGGRVIPFFTARRFQMNKPQAVSWLEWAATLPLILLFILSFFPLAATLLATKLMLIAGLFQLIRALRWKPWQTLREPLVWSLHLAYLCLPLSLLIRGASSSAFINHTFLHLFAIGALGGVILSMLARVTMGHTGREIYHGPVMWPAYLALVAAAIIRTFAVSLWPAEIILFVRVTGGLWIFAFAFFCWHFVPMLMRPRVDGHPG
ncbi:NnrS family protein [Thaumasiovibrio sp. DFM-14]|uniref:NnrS family protein n=1 Tax=Thaumasiovibrio sp. DFM-14 TaxID=3384792 RepID=UPI00399F7331